MHITLTIGLHLPANVHRPEFLRRAVRLLLSLQHMLSHPNHYTDRAIIGSWARDLLETPRHTVAIVDESWRAAATFPVTPDGLQQIRIRLRLTDDIDTRAFQRRIDALFEQLEIRMAQPSEHHRIDAAAITYAAQQLLETPREYADQVLSEVGYVAAY